MRGLLVALFLINIVMAEQSGVIDGSFHKNSCAKREFNIKITDGIKVREILSQIAQQCDLSVISGDTGVLEALNSEPLSVNIANADMRSVLDMLLGGSDLSYELSERLLKISSQLTKTFKIDYITSARSGRAACVGERG